MKNEQIIRSVEVEEVVDGSLPYEEMTATADQTIDSNGKIPPLNPEVKQAAYNLYLEGLSYKHIADKLEIKENTIKSWSRRDGWMEQRKGTNNQVLAELLEDKKLLLGELVTEILTASLKAVKRDAGKNGFKAKDVGKYLSVLSSIEKISLLLQGKATTIKEERSKRANFTLPLEHLNKIQAVQDPFSSITQNGTPSTDPAGTSGAT